MPACLWHCRRVRGSFSPDKHLKSLLEIADKGIEESHTVGGVQFMQVFTVGYEGKSIDELLEQLSETGISVLVDVRWMPLSRKPGFSKTKLSEAVRERQIEYEHFRELGAPPELRKELGSTGDYESFFRVYEERLRSLSPDIEKVARLSRTESICLLCFEAEPARCHRSRLAAELRRKTHCGVRHL